MTTVDLSSHDLHAAMNVVQRLYAEPNLETLPRRMLAELGDLVPCEHSSYNEVDASTNRAFVVMVPDVQRVFELQEVLEAHFDTHPILGHWRRSGSEAVVQWADLVSIPAFQQTALYQDFFRHVDTRHQAGLLLSEPGAPCNVTIGVNRLQRAFSDRDLALMRLLRPHLVQARAHALAFRAAELRVEALSSLLEHLDAAFLLLSPSARILEAPPAARTLLLRYFPEARPASDHLPGDLEAWVHAGLKGLRSGDLDARHHRPLRVAGPSGELELRLAGPTEGPFRLLLREYRRPRAEQEARRLGLSAREFEVLHWIREGKTSPAVAAILGISSRTVHKHVEHILAKLGAETRQAALSLTRTWAWPD